MIKRTLIACCLSCSCMPLVNAEINKQFIAGQAATLYQTEDTRVKQAVLYYRVTGSKIYLSSPLQLNGDQWVASLPAPQVIAPGIEYYIELRYQDGSRVTEPSSYAKHNPLRVSVKPAASIQLSQIRVDDKDLRFSVNGYADAQTRVMLGDVDVSYLAQRDGTSWIIKDVSQYLNGDGRLQLLDAAGNELASDSVQMPGEDVVNAVENGELILRGNLSFNVGGQQDDNDETDDSLALTGNLNLETEYLNGDFRSHFSGINVNYDKDAEDEFNLSSGFLLSNTYQQHTLDIGDVSVSGAPLVISGFSRRGISFTTKGDRWKGGVFNVRTSTVEGWESGISFDDRQTYGVNYEQTLGDKADTKIQVSSVSGELQQTQTDNVGSSSAAPQSGDSVGMLVSSSVAGVIVEAQLASSQFDNDTRDADSGQKDSAYEIKLAKDLFGLASSVGYQHYGANYATIANPNFSGDREAYNLSLGSHWQFVSWSTSFSTTQDNVDKDPARSVVTSDNLGFNLGFVFENWPDVNLGYNLNQQTSEDEPDVSQEVDNEGYDISLGVSEGFQNYHLAWTGSLGEIRDNLDALNKSETRNHSVNLAYNLDAVNLSVNLSQNENISSFTQTSRLLNVGINLPVFTDGVVLNSQFSLQQNEASDASEDNEISGGSARVSWSLDDIVSLKSMGWFNPQFSVSWTMNKVTDHLDATANESDSRIMLDFSFGAPYNFEKRWKFGEAEK